ncbi:platelet-activating factor acetylhydrolase [Lophiotrema nucula]|uniref:Putative phospholipase n=1 Tax=Lophiotrema nucula TaxID=690887 RepID=A0A6A5YZB2_9PLEO|nr:platelet-activating factor acetylhydrolase [Lophiotrema nucula]
MGWLSGLNPTPSFPAYTGPYKVGSTDVEIPVTDLESPSPAPSKDIPTVAFRVFYPCNADSQQRAVRWIPSPQREYLGAYARFLGANSAFSQIFSLLPQLLNYVSIPVHRNADVLEPPTQSKKWPVMVFSHGLGGSRNAYSHLVGSLASHGIVVVAPDHRDGSSPASFIHSADGKVARRVEYKKLAHNASTEVYEGRDEQLRIRLWELGLIHDAIQSVEEGRAPQNVAGDGGNVLRSLSNKLDVRKPGSISFAGHSFGAATMIQFVKSVSYLSGARDPAYKPLFTPSMDSSIVHQITPASPVILLDLWTLPIQSPATAWLRAKPMPCYSSPDGGSNLLAILSEAFYKWSSNLQDTKRIVAKPSGSDVSGPHIFYPIASAHLSQSDFGILFPWVTTKVFGAKEPERVLKLNVRAILQVLRNSHIEVANTSAADLELEGAPGVTQDERILVTEKDSVRGWISLSTDSSAAPAKTSKGPSDAVMEGEVLGEMVGTGRE